jgi:hypothetical protein
VDNLIGRKGALRRVWKNKIQTEEKSWEFRFCLIQKVKRGNSNFK